MKGMKHNEENTEETELESKRLRKLVTQTLKEEKRQNGRKQLKVLEEERDTVKIWSTIRDYLNWGKTGGPPSALINKIGNIAKGNGNTTELLLHK